MKIIGVASLAVVLLGCPGPSGKDGGSSFDGGSKDGGGGTDSGTAFDAGPQDFPASSLIYSDISALSADPSSPGIIAHLAASAAADAGAWGTPGTGLFTIDFSILVQYADNTVATRLFSQAAGFSTPDCDLVPVPVPTGGAMEGSSDYRCSTAYQDCHLLVYQGTRLYELFHANITGGMATGGSFTAGCEAVWDLTRDYWQSGTPYSRGDQCTSADEVGLPVAPLLVTGAELANGNIPHALRFRLPNQKVRPSVYLHPATAVGNPSGDALMPAFGSRFRLRPDFPVASLSASAQTVAVALQKHGMFLVDGANVPLTMEQSASAYINAGDLSALAVTDFDIVPSPDPAVNWAAGTCQRTQLTQ